MNITKIAVLNTYGKLIELSNKNYVYPSQNTLLILLKKHYHIIIKRRSLCYHLADLRKDGLIKSIKRYDRAEAGTIIALSSAVCLTIKGCRLLFKFGSAWARKHIYKLRLKFGFPEKRPHEAKPGPMVSGKPLSDVFKADMTDPLYLKKYPHMRKLVESKYGKQLPPSPGSSLPGSTEDPKQK
jgi:hypothetical protein